MSRSISQLASSGGDGAADLVVVNKADNTVQVLTNNGNGVFAAGPAVTTGGNFRAPSSLATLPVMHRSNVAVVHVLPLNNSTPFGGVTLLQGNGPVA